MKVLKYIGIVALVFSLTIACKKEHTPEVKTLPVAEAPAKKKELNPDATYAKAEFTIEGMSCAVGCAAKIEKTIAGMDGVKSAKVDFENKIAMVEYDVEEVNPDQLTKTVAKVGEYTVENMKTVEDFSSLE
ncbi:MAG: heavy-metal-associated domain-containing protein [Flavobacteriaceae bacterium]|nr:heavy-metal-associated domain-containing protein [Flavobacteriaceae bacterium]